MRRPESLFVRLLLALFLLTTLPERTAAQSLCRKNSDCEKYLSLARTLVRKNDYPPACKALSDAYFSLDSDKRIPELLINIGRCSHHAKDLYGALDWYKEYFVEIQKRPRKLDSAEQSRRNVLNKYIADAQKLKNSLETNVEDLTIKLIDGTHFGAMEVSLTMKPGIIARRFSIYLSAKDKDNCFIAQFPEMDHDGTQALIILKGFHEMASLSYSIQVFGEYSEVVGVRGWRHPGGYLDLIVNEGKEKLRLAKSSVSDYCVNSAQ